MPLYDYQCRACGPFRDWRPMAEAERAVRCPSCGKSSPRAVAAPRLGMESTTRSAHARNEKSAHEPTVVRRLKGGHQHHGHDHGHSHGQGHGHGHGKAQGRAAKRPWMIGH